MGSRDKEQTTPHHQPLLSSLVVRPSVSDGGGDGGGGRGGGSDYEPGEVRRDPPPTYRSDRYSDEPALNVACKNLGLEEGIMVCHQFLSLRKHLRLPGGKWKSLAAPMQICGLSWIAHTEELIQRVAADNNDQSDSPPLASLISVCIRCPRLWTKLSSELLARLVLNLVAQHSGFGVNKSDTFRTRAGSVSPIRRRDADHRYGSNFDHSGGMPRSREFGSGKDHDRYRDPSPPYARGRGGGRPFGRGFDGPALGPGPLRGEGMNRNNPNVRPREGDWVCPDPSCGNLNFARREYCNNCKRFRYAPGGSLRRGYPGPPPPPPPPPRRFPGLPMDISPARPMNGYRSPPRGWGRDGHGPREFVAGGPPPSRHEGRFSDHMRRDRLDFPDDGYRGRNKPMPPMDWGHRDRGRDNFFNERKGYRRAPSPPPAPPVPPHRGRWGRDMRERSRSPIRGAPPPKDYRRDMYMERGRDDRRGIGRDRIGDAY
ncbi:hypothetical protein Pint_13206 [Pistacia integerrima]|uniref:Uncharacterized protein n=1 Tax=Pistacia integerrima TaxID=434235 RepID=A0ACC0Y6F2_9ROSI|nr:hypothetical protein Pint_13206 [Pistacia integerrima]